MHRLRLLLCSCSFLVAACGPKAPTKPDGDFVAINPYPETVGSFARRPPSDHFEFTYRGDLKEALQFLQRLQPQLSIRPPQGRPSEIPVEVDLKNVTLNETLVALRDQSATSARLDFNPSQERRRPYAQILYLSNSAKTP